MTIPKPTPFRNVAQKSFSGPFSNESHGGSSLVVDCLDHLIESDPMSDEQDWNAQRTRLMEIWHGHGQTLTFWKRPGGCLGGWIG